MLIVGGGAAGAALAWLLAGSGRSVWLVERGRAHHSGPFETMLAPARTMLARTGLLPLLDACGERDPLRHGAIWGGEAVEWRRDGDAGLLLRRGPFDERLRAAAARAGAVVCCPASAVATADRERWDVATPTGRVALRAARVVFATGRATGGVDAAAVGPPAIAFTWLGTPDPADRGTAVVEAVPCGWTWTHAPVEGEASTAVVVDADELRAVGRERLLARVFAASRGPAGRLTAARLLHGTDATPRVAAADPDVLRIGDAAATIDPLASQGVEKALAAADHAAAVLAAAHERPEWWSRLQQVHARWERGLFTGHRDVAGAWYRREERFADEPFWRRRRLAEAAVAPAVDATWQVDAAVVPASVLVREGRTFVEREGHLDRRTGETATHVGYVPIAPLLAAFAGGCSLAEAVARAGRDARLFVLPPRAVHGAMVELARRGWLTAPASAAGNR